MKLHLVTTPIGNLEDITIRALGALKKSDLVICEDTRVTKSLFEKLEVALDKTFISFNDHQQDKVEFLYQKILSASFPVLVSDAGSPVVSDPGFPLIEYCLEKGLDIDTFPGVSAPLVAMELSGLPPHPFTFHGFLPRKKGEIESLYKACSSSKSLHIFFESPHRILASLEILAKSFPTAKVSVSRELTKLYQTSYRFKASDYRAAEITAKGEFVLCVLFEAKCSGNIDNSEILKTLSNYLDKQTPKNLAKLISTINGQKVSDIYQLLTNK